jgi:peptidoglycan/xylan/chitin deacetylase (PgdA/CDA1 family)
MKFIPSISVILSLVSIIKAQNITNTAQPIATAIPTRTGTSTTSTGGQLTEAYPADGAIPSPKPEWLDLIKNANITNAPVLKSQGSNGPSTSGQDLYCDWAKSGCMGTSIGDCPKGMWGLTYDDGPSEVSPTLYDFLKTTNQKATLFMIGANVIKYPQTVKRAFDEGHEIAIHTWTHDYMTTLSNERIVAELKWTELAIKEITGRSPRLFRPPYGDIDNRVRDIGTALGFTSVIWDHDTNDWMLGENAPGFQAEWIDGNFTQWIAEASTATTGGLSLEHDIQKSTVDAAIKNLPALQKAYKVVTVGQCAGIPSYKESNSTLPLNTTSVSSVVPSATPTIVTPAAPTLAPSQIAKQVTNSSLGISVHTASLSIVLFALSICTLYLF